MRKAIFASLGIGLVFSTMPAHAATVDVRIAAYNYTPSGHLVVGNPFGGPSADTPTTDTPVIAATDTLRFTNLDAVNHTVSKVPGSTPKCPTTGCPTGKTDSWVDLVFPFAAPNTTMTLVPLSGKQLIPGTYTYQCFVHTIMRGSFTVS